MTAAQPLRGSPSTPSPRPARRDLSFSRFSRHRLGTNLQRRLGRTSLLSPGLPKSAPRGLRHEERDPFTPKMILKSECVLQGTRHHLRQHQHISPLPPAQLLLGPLERAALRATLPPPVSSPALQTCKTSHVQVLRQPPPGHTCQPTLEESINGEGGLIQTPPTSAEPGSSREAAAALADLWTRTQQSEKPRFNLSISISSFFSRPVSRFPFSFLEQHRFVSAGQGKKDPDLAKKTLFSNSAGTSKESQDS